MYEDVVCTVLYMHTFIIAIVTVHSIVSVKPVEFEATAALILLLGFNDCTVSPVLFTGTFTALFIVSGILNASFGIKFSDEIECDRNEAVITIVKIKEIKRVSGVQKVVKIV